MSPETLTEEKYYFKLEDLLNKNADLSEAKEKDLAVAANGWAYRKDVRGFLPILMEEMYTNRSKFKKQMLKNEQERQDIEKEMTKRGLKFLK
jgi:DNA polymerase elongation subunit (family B)